MEEGDERHWVYQNHEAFSLINSAVDDVSKLKAASLVGDVARSVHHRCAQVVLQSSKLSSPVPKIFCCHLAGGTWAARFGCRHRNGRTRCQVGLLLALLLLLLCCNTAHRFPAEQWEIQGMEEEAEMKSMSACYCMKVLSLYNRLP